MVNGIALSDDGTYIILTVEGEVTRQSAMQQNLEAHALGRELGVNRYLVDMRAARNIESPLDGYRFAYEDMQQTPGIDRNARVAVLVSPGDHSHDFIETVARNSGLHVTLFTNYKQAVRYLTGG